MATTQTPAMATAEQVQRVAALLSGIADAFNERLKTEAGKLTQGEVYARLQEEQRLRSFSNQLYFEAADLVLADAVADQQELEDRLGEAKAKLAKIQAWAAALDLVADVLVLAGALMARKPQPILAAFKEVKKDLKAMPKDAPEVQQAADREAA